MFGQENGKSSDDSYTWLVDRMPTLPYFDAVLASLTYALRKVRFSVADSNEGVSDTVDDSTCVFHLCDWGVGDVSACVFHLGLRCW